MEGKKQNTEKNCRKVKKEKVANVDFTDFSFIEIPHDMQFSNLRITEQDLQNSAIYKILHDEFVSPHCSMDQSREKDLEDLQYLRTKLENSNNSTYTYRENHQFVPLRVEQSVLSKKEHIDCLRGLQIITSGCKPNPEDEKNVSLFINYESKRLAEYIKFLKHVETNWKNKNKLRTLNIQIDLKCFINLYWRWKQNKVLDYPKDYRVMSLLPLGNSMKNQPKTKLSVYPQEIVYQCGNSKFIDIQQFNENTKCINNCENLESKTIKNKIHTALPSVSQDTVCIENSKKYNANIVISSSGLKCLLDNHAPKYLTEWIIPIVIKEFDMENDYKKQKVVFIEKPLPKLKYSIHQQNHWAHKISLKASAMYGWDKISTSEGVENKALRRDLIEYDDTFDYCPKSPEMIPTIKIEKGHKEEQDFQKDVDKNKLLIEKQEEIIPCLEENINTRETNISDDNSEEILINTSTNENKLCSGSEEKNCIENLTIIPTVIQEINTVIDKTTDVVGNEFIVNEKINISCEDIPDIDSEKVISPSVKNENEKILKEDDEKNAVIAEENIKMVKHMDSEEDKNVIGQHSDLLNETNIEKVNIENESQLVVIDEAISKPLINNMLNSQGFDSDSDELLIDESFNESNVCSDDMDIEISNKRVTRSMSKNKSSDSISSDSPVRKRKNNDSMFIKKRSISRESLNTEEPSSKKLPVKRNNVKINKVLGEMFNVFEEETATNPTNIINMEGNKASENNFYEKFDTTIGNEDLKIEVEEETSMTNKNVSQPEQAVFPVNSLDMNQTKHRTTYRIWKFQESNDDASLLEKNISKELKVLIRTKSHGKIKIGNIEKEVTMTPKLDYQMEYGAECASLSECTRQWCSLFFQPDTALVRVRINPTNSNISMHELLDLNGVTNEILRIHKHNPEKDLNRLFRIFSIMHSSLHPGSYILKHNVKMVEAAKLYMADDSSDSSEIQLNLHQLYENVSLDKVSLEQSVWNPIDPLIITPKHMEEGILPGMFCWKQEARYNNKQRGTKTRGRPKKRLKGKS